MLEPTIVCPNCNNEIRLTESLAAPLIEAARREYEQRLMEKTKEFSERELVLKEREEAVSKARASVDNAVAQQLARERPKIADDEERKARQALATDIERNVREIAELQQVLRQRELKLAEAQQAQLDLLKKQRELEDAKREVELTVEKKLQTALVTARQEARAEAESQLKLKVLEREQTIASMQRQIEDLKRKAEQGSQQLQGEVLELELESLLKMRFPQDVIEGVPKGVHGGDVLQRVSASLGQHCGTIIWEAKRTKNWNDGWLVKLREDQRAAKAEMAVVVSEALPKDIEVFDLVEGVWVAHPRAAIAIAAVLRQSLIELASARQASEGHHSKMEMVYQYVTSLRFRHRIQAIVESFSSMQEDLNRERKLMNKQWAKREGQIQQIMQAAVGVYGDLQGITGKTLQEIEGLLLDSREEDRIAVDIESITRA
jgi:hypothetical protein